MIGIGIGAILGIDGFNLLGALTGNITEFDIVIPAVIVVDTDDFVIVLTVGVGKFIGAFVGAGVDFLGILGL